MGLRSEESRFMQPLVSTLYPHNYFYHALHFVHAMFCDSIVWKALYDLVHWQVSAVLKNKFFDSGLIQQFRASIRVCCLSIYLSTWTRVYISVVSKTCSQRD